VLQIIRDAKAATARKAAKKTVKKPWKEPIVEETIKEEPLSDATLLDLECIIVAVRER